MLIKTLFLKKIKPALKQKFLNHYKKKKKHWVLKYFDVKKLKKNKYKIILNKKGKDFCNSFLGKIKKDHFSFKKSSILLINKVKPGKRKIPPQKEVIEYILKGKNPFCNYFRILARPKREDYIFQKIIFNYLNREFKKIFSSNSYAYRSFSKKAISIRGTTIAIKKLEKIKKNKLGTKIDIKRFFDSVDHKIILKILNKMLNSKKIKISEEEKHFFKKTIKNYLISIDDTYKKYCKKFKGKGIFQGHPLSCLLANLYLTPLDNHLEKRKIKFFRYADDILILTKNEKDGKKAFEICKNYLKKYLKLKINKKKSLIGKENFEFLGFKFQKDGTKIIRESSMERAKEKIRNLTNFLKREDKIGRIILEINQFLGFTPKRQKGKNIKDKVKIRKGYYIGKGWIDYFAECSNGYELEKQMKDLDSFTLRRLISYKLRNTKWNKKILRKERIKFYKMGLRSFFSALKIALNKRKKL